MADEQAFAHRNEVMKRWCHYMEWLDRLGYATAGFSLLILGMLVFIHAWYVFLAGQFDPKGHVLILPVGLRLLNDILLVIILLRALLTWGSEVSANALARQAKTGLRSQLLRRIFAQGPAYVRGERTGELVSVAVEGIEALDAYFSQYLLPHGRHQPEPGR